MLLTVFIFIALGIAIKYGKMYFLIAGYNTMSPEEKAEYDIEKIANIGGNVFFGMALIILLGHLLAKYFSLVFIETTALFVAILIGIPYLLIKANAAKKK